MSGISINLLPAQSRIDQKALRKFRIIQTSSTTFLLILIFSASLVTALNILQSQGASKLKSESGLREEKIVELKEKEIQVSVLKNRLSLINQINKLPEKDKSVVYRTVLSFIPESINISSISVDRGGSVVTSIIAPDIITLEKLISSLTQDETFDSISKIDFESLSRARDGTFRAILKVQI